MDWNNNDPFESIIREFLGDRPSNGRRKVIRGEEEDRVIDYIEGDDKVYLVFEVPGYTKKDILVAVNGKSIEVTAKKEGKEAIQPYLSQKLGEGNHIKKLLPEIVNPKKFSYTVKNGVLEVAFEKK